MIKKYDSYRSSGIEWLGDIPSHWDVKKLKYIGNAIIGLTYSPSNVVDEKDGTLVLRASNIQNGKIELTDNVFVNTKIPEKLKVKIGDILICSRNGSRHLIGKNALITSESKDMTFGAFTTVFRSKFNEYLYYIFNSSLFTFQSASFLTSTINQLTTGNLNNFQIPIPPKDEQGAIADFLDKKCESVDKYILKQKELIELLKEKKSSLINKAVTKGLDSKVEYKDSGIEWLGKIPKHWEVKKLKYITKNLNNKRVPIESTIRGKMKNRIYDYYGATGVIDKVDSYIFDEPSIVIAEDGANLVMRNIKLVYLAEGKYWVNNHAHILKANINQLREYVAHFLESYDYNPLISGSAQPKLTKERFMNIEVVCPPKEEQTQIVEYIEKESSKIDKAISHIENEIKLLQEYKQSLISSAVTGKIKVV